MTPLAIETTCTACQGNWRVDGDPAHGGSRYDYCEACTARVYHGEPEHGGQQCACGCLERMPEGAERVVVAGGKVWRIECLAWARLRERDEHDSEARIPGECERIRAEVARRFERVQLGSFDALRMGAVIGDAIIAVAKGGV